MEPKYSVLLCNQQIATYKGKIKEWLLNGIKVIWFSTNTDEVIALKSEYKDFSKAFILMAYSVTITNQTIIIDGEDKEQFVKNVLTEACPLFNSAQYLVEHCKASEHIIVQASAGTGKTKVMIDRILYLLHTQPELHLSEVFMITFTHDATDQMNERLQEILLERYKLTRQQKYLRWVEEQSQMHISTIHSFCYFILKEYGIGESFTRNLSIRSFKYERKELIKDTIDENIDEGKTVISQLGIPFYKANFVVDKFWGGFSKLGISHADMLEMDWGEPVDDDSVAFHQLISNSVETLDDEYFDIKRQNEGIAVDDIMRDLQNVLLKGNLPNPDFKMKYLFIDEFQDSDLSQIKIACLMIKLLNPALFVVGDVKQSIYRFRGASDQAFLVLKQDMKDMGIKAPIDFTLVNNYRTSKDLLERMDSFFIEWNKRDRLQYDKAVIPFNQTPGRIKMLYGEREEEAAEQQIVDVTNKELNALINLIENQGKTASEKTRVVLLTRSNKELYRLSALLRKHKIPAVIKRDGSFYSSEAVRDFYIMIASFLFCDEPKYVFNYLLTPYAGEIDPMNINDMEWLHGDKENLVAYLDRFLEQTTWKKFHKQLRLRPILSVIKEMMDDVSVVDNYILNLMNRKRAEGWEHERCLAATYQEALQYQANLEKLMNVLQRNMNGEKVSLYDVYNFLKLNIASNRSENEAEVITNDEQVKDLYKSVLCMTVHKSKGLEFETVIIPYTNRSIVTYPQTEILIDPVTKEVGWNYTGEKKNKKTMYTPMKNTLYDELKQKDLESSLKEDARILYVALTRAITNLICIVPQSRNEKTWASLLGEVGTDYE